MGYVPKHFECNVNLDYEDDYNSLSLYEKLCYVKTLVETYTAMVESFQDQLDEKEDSSNITSSRKLSENGNFTGTWQNKTYSEVFGKVDSNTDLIEYLTNQFSDGRTGLVIEGGFFEDTGINNNYNGGYF